ncbi:hypothetical protein VTI74DRAFT_9121 [Chaetomium olivicolor]
MSTKPPLQPNKIDKEFERQVAQKTLEARPDEVTSSSTVRHVLEQSQAPAEGEPDVMEGLKSDLETVKETFALASVPREAYALGLAGTLPYMATSLSTAYLSWNLNHEWPTQSMLLNTLLFNHESAGHWLHLLEPIQVGYGAVIISFLGAIHWGLEFAEKKPNHERTRFRYGMGVLAPAMAWPTIFMPLEWALTTQFAAFSALYFADSRATVKAWAPPWYATYRFVLTAVVGTALLVSLIGRAKVGEGHTRLSHVELAERIKGKRASSEQYHNWAKEEAKERERIKKEKKREAEQKAKEEEKKEQTAAEKQSGKESGKKKDLEVKESEQKTEEKSTEKSDQKPQQEGQSDDKDSEKEASDIDRDTENNTEAAARPQQEKDMGERKSEKTDEKVNRK